MTSTSREPVQGAGLGFRRPFVKDLDDLLAAPIDFLELAPENWIGLGGRLGRALDRLADAKPLVAHGLCLDLGGQRPIDRDFLSAVKAFMARLGIRHYTDHLSFCGDDGHLYDLLPLPFTEEAVTHVAGRIMQVQDFLGERIGVENVSYYCAQPGTQSECEFLCAVLERADCLLHLDVNNVYVNSVNHGIDARAYIDALPGDRICHAHIAGHHRRGPVLIVDTHGAPIEDPVWDLLAHAYARHGVFPTLVERDANIPPFRELMPEVERVRALQQAAAGRAAPTAEARSEVA
jgi:uncharacterized protein (UPF0276 family)